MEYVNGYLNYTGSKYKLLSQLLKEFDYSKSTFIDLFTGSMVVSANIVDKYDKIIVNDIIENLIEIHENILESDEIIEKTKLLSNTKNNKELFLKLRESYNEKKSPEKLFALILGCTSNLMRFNKKGKFNQTWGKRQWNESTEKKVINFVNHIRPYKNKITFESKEFYKIEPKKSNFVYIDPPYGRIKDTNGLISNKQISESGYNNLWSKEHDIKLYEYIHKLEQNKSTFMVSGVLEHNGNISWMLDKLIQDGFKYKELVMDYNKISKIGNKNTKEIIIMNY